MGFIKLQKIVPADGLITFIIPSLGRPSLKRTLDSLIAQTSPKWKAIVVFDGIGPNINSPDPRIQIMTTSKKGHAGFVRNEGIKVATTEWIGFVDDDDVLTPEYVETFLKEKEHYEAIIFRMKATDGRILPVPGDTDFKLLEVGISFCMKRTLALNRKMIFRNKPRIAWGLCEDWTLLEDIRANGFRIKMSEAVTYICRPE